MNNNPFYTCEEIQFLLFESVEKAMVARKHGLKKGYGYVGKETFGNYYPVYPTLDYWSKITKSCVQISEPAKIIYQIKDDYEFWHVIIGDKVGWINVPLMSRKSIKQIENNNNNA